MHGDNIDHLRILPGEFPETVGGDVYVRCSKTRVGSPLHFELFNIREVILSRNQEKQCWYPMVQIGVAGQTKNSRRHCRS